MFINAPVIFTNDCVPPLLLLTFPTEKHNSLLRPQWTKAINRTDDKSNKNWIPNTDARVCTDHFIGGLPSALHSQVPTLQLGYTSIMPVSSRKPPTF